jgi:photosystem II stability/assembly factor-like uncharacterized protein
MFSRRDLLSLALATPALAQGQLRWRPVLTIDDPGYQIRLHSACCVTGRILLAAATLVNPDDRSRRSILLVSEDGGLTWVRRKAPGAPRALFSLGESHVWFLGEDRLWFSSDAGWTFRSLAVPKRTQLVHFRTSLLGFALGRESLHVSADGGANWAPLPEAANPKWPRALYWNRAVFQDDRHGILAAIATLPLARGATGPDGAVLSARQLRDLGTHGLALLETADAGQTWQPRLLSAPGAPVDLLYAQGALTGAFLANPDSRRPGVVARFSRNDTSWQTLLEVDGLSPFSLTLFEGELHAAAIKNEKAEVLALDAAGQWRRRPVHYSALGNSVRFFSGPRAEPWLLLPTGMILAPVS